MKPLLGPITEAQLADDAATRYAREAAREGDRGRELREKVAAALPHIGDHPAADELVGAIADFDARGDG